MNTVKEPKQKFKPIFLYRDDERINRIKEDNKDWLAYLQNGLELSEKLFDDPITDEERTEILSKGWKGTEELIKAKSQFPKAKIQTLLELQGKDGDEAKEASKYMASRFAAIGASVEDGTVIMPGDKLKELEDQYTYYTTTEKQNEAYRIAEVISEQVEKAIDLGIADRTDRQMVVNALRHIIDQSLVNGSNRLGPAVKRLKRIGEPRY